MDSSLTQEFRNHEADNLRALTHSKPFQGWIICLISALMMQLSRCAGRWSPQGSNILVAVAHARHCLTLPCLAGMYTLDHSTLEKACYGVNTVSMGCSSAVCAVDVSCRPSHEDSLAISVRLGEWPAHPVLAFSTACISISMSSTHLFALQALCCSHILVSGSVWA
jgi:hypothetical protein